MAEKAHRTGNLSPEYVLLGFLIIKPSHGYDLHQRFTAELGYVWHLSQSQTYGILKRLEDRGDISTQLVEQEKLPSRQMLRVTASGRDRFFEWLEQEVGKNARSIRLEFLSRLYFAQLLRPESIGKIYNAQAAEIGSAIARLGSLAKQVPPEQAFNRLSIDLRFRQLQLIQYWMAELRTELHIPAERT
jgi:DNA-binding PadR family transcriptional regulator